MPTPILVMEKCRVVWQGESAALAGDDHVKNRYLGV
jgi:ABC-type branched-subunit amino acid transport system ATPase component